MKYTTFLALILLSASLLSQPCEASDTTALWRVSVKVFADPGESWPRDTGNPLTTGPADRGEGMPLLVNSADEANRALRSPGSVEAVDLLEIIELPDMDEWNKRAWSSHDDGAEPCEAIWADLEAAAKADPQAYAWRDDAINVYYLNCASTIAGGLAAYPEMGDIVIITPRVNTSTLVHEIGHHMSLRHTHGGVPLIDCSTVPAASTIALTPGDDGLNFTLPDHPCYTIDDLSIRTFGIPFNRLSLELARYSHIMVPNYGPYPVFAQRLVQETRDNVMSYHSGGDRFTFEQMGRMRIEAESSRAGEVRYQRLRVNDLDPHMPWSQKQQMKRELPAEFYGDWAYKSGAREWADWVTVREETIGRVRYYANIDSSVAALTGYQLPLLPILYGDSLSGTPLPRNGLYTTYSARITEDGDLRIRIAGYNRTGNFSPFFEKAVTLRRPNHWDYIIRGKHHDVEPVPAPFNPVRRLP